MAERVPEADAVLRDVVATYRERQDVTTKRMFGSPALLVDGRVACFANGAGSLVAELPAERVAALHEAGLGGAWAMRGRRMREWAALPLDPRVDWFEIAAAAVAFVGSAPDAAPDGRPGADADATTSRGR